MCSPHLTCNLVCENLDWSVLFAWFLPYRTERERERERSNEAGAIETAQVKESLADLEHQPASVHDGSSQQRHSLSSRDGGSGRRHGVRRKVDGGSAGAAQRST